MEITGSQVIAAPRQRVWDALNDPLILEKSLPGCESVERTAENEFKVVMAAAIGPLRAKFNGRLAMSDVRAPEACTMVFEGQGGAVGFGKGNSSVTLSEASGQTTLKYTAEAQVGGKLAQVGSRLIDSVARKMADDFFKAFKSQLALASPPVTVDASARPDGAEASGPKDKVMFPSTGAPSRERGPAAVQAPAVAQTEADSPQPSSGLTGIVMVPGWWLGVAAAFGCAATVLGFLLAR